MAQDIYALVRSSSSYHGQSADSDTHFQVTLNTDSNQLADGYYIRGGVAGNYRPEDLDLYIKTDDGFAPIKRKSWVA